MTTINNITIPMHTAASFVVEEAKKLQATLALAKARNIIDQREYESTAMFLLRTADMCKAITEEKIAMIDYYAEQLDKISSEKQAYIENGLEKAAQLNQNTFKNFFGWMSELEKAMI